MTERLLQFIWQFQYFNTAALVTESGGSVRVLHPGRHNTHQGPDFLEASIMIDDVLLAGSIELHVLSSGWNAHGHCGDAHYRNVILHVVWEDDAVAPPPGIPVLLLKGRVSRLLLQRYEEWMEQKKSIACGSLAATVNGLVRQAWLDRLLAERLTRKSAYALQLAADSRFNWEEVCWQLLARNFGGPVNAHAFEQMARSLPLKLLKKHRSNPSRLEALLMGQAGLLNRDDLNEYGHALKKEYLFYQHKYRLSAPVVPASFLRMRPPAFPTVRLAQLAALLGSVQNLFALIRDAEALVVWLVHLNAQTPPYWDTHYAFEERPSRPIPKAMGTEMLHTIIINTVAPLLFAYGQHHREELMKEKAMQWLAQIPAEKNHVTKQWAELGIGCRFASESQALLELKSQYCDTKRCLDCSIGNALLRK